VKSIGYPLHSPVSPSLSLPCVTVCHHISTGLYIYTFLLRMTDTMIYQNIDISSWDTLYKQSGRCQDAQPLFPQVRTH